jgi:hypothetical protein
MQRVASHSGGSHFSMDSKVLMSDTTVHNYAIPKLRRSGHNRALPVKSPKELHCSITGVLNEFELRDLHAMFP